MENMKERVECSFSLKAGAILRVSDGKGGRTLYSNANLTDAVARAWLKANPQSAVLFAKMPAGFMDELKADVVGKVKAAAEAVTATGEAAARVAEAAAAVPAQQAAVKGKPATGKKTTASGKKSGKKK